MAEADKIKNNKVFKPLLLTLKLGVNVVVLIWIIVVNKDTKLFSKIAQDV